MKTTALVVACLVIVMVAPGATFAHDCAPLTTVTSGRNPCNHYGADCSYRLRGLYRDLIRAQERGKDTRRHERRIMEYFAYRERKVREDINRMQENIDMILKRY
ncbi:MAG: hypothetical protein OXI88_23070 [Gammaproteobacteria bacterium]|nr:hypothetical protein [Gammaproteobacteria bacterium]MDE0283413.1 hypothetical protein [Gammaproteobacteria bacterium]MDE0514650.1 hypothetical protein [Gammaproteobacteria bacterium]